MGRNLANAGQCGRLLGEAATCAAKRSAGIVCGLHGEAYRNPLPGIAAMRKGRQAIPDDLFANTKLVSAAKPLTIFRAELTGCDEAGWEDLFAGYTALKAITFSSSIELLLRLAKRLDDLEIVFGSESILSQEHLALAQASQTVAAYGFADALIDQKVLVEGLSRLLGRAGRQLLDRVVAGSLRFRLLRGRPSHEKLYLLSGPSGSRVLTGFANLGRAAFEGWQHEILVVFDGEPAWRLFDAYYQRDWKDSVPVEPDALVAMGADGVPVPREEPLQLDEVPIVRVLSAGIALIDQPPRPAPAGFAAEALREAAALGAELKDLALPKDKSGRTVVNAGAVLRMIRSHNGRPVRPQRAGFRAERPFRRCRAARS